MGRATLPRLHFCSKMKSVLAWETNFFIALIFELFSPLK